MARLEKDSLIGGRYRVVRLLGAGGMGSVYEAIDASTGARVAVKVITAEAAASEVLMSRFAREAEAAAAIDTPHIVRVLGSGRDEERHLPFLVMEYLDGEDLHQLIKRLGALSPDLALRIAAQACLGLQKAHEARIVHRDIKPANFFLAQMANGERVVKLLDFGVAKIKSDPTAASSADAAELTRTGSMLGSPLYMSPEQARGRRDLDHRSDIWSFGVVLYASLCGHTPHRDTDLLGELLILICTEAPEPLQVAAPWVAPELASLVHRALRFDPAERFQSAGEMRAAITALLPGDARIHEQMLRPLGDGERAARIFRLLNPILRTGTCADSDHYRVEPYVLAGDVYGAPPWVGRGGWTWYTGAAAWAWRLGVEGILGLRKEAGELRIDPCIPPTWPGFEAWVRVGARHVHVVVENPDAVSRGVATLTLDGVPIASNRLPLDPSVSGEHEVRVRLGENAGAPNATKTQPWQAAPSKNRSA